MTKTLSFTFIDILSPYERKFYGKYRAGVTLLPWEVSVFEAIVTKKRLFALETARIEKKAKALVPDEDLERIGIARRTLYEAWVWGQTN